MAKQTPMTDSTGKDTIMFAENIGKEDQVDVQLEDKADAREEHFSARDIQGRFDLLRDLSDAEMEKLNKSVVKKIDWRMMPYITIMFLMSYLDRINVSNAKLAGLQEDLHMTDTVWNTGISTFYIGYLVGQLPGNLWLAKANPRWFLPSVMVAWSAATICMPAMTSGAGFAVCRFFIGLAEAPFFPGITLMTSSWYTKAENPMRMAIWHAGNTISNILSGFLAAGILTTMDDIGGLHAWQWFFIIEGAASILMALAAFYLLPDWPHNTRFLSSAEREMAQYRVLCSNGGKDEGIGGTWDGIKEAVMDPFTWFFCLMHFALVTAQAFKDFMPSESFWHIVIPIIGSMVGCAVLISTENIGARYFGLFLLISGTYNGLNLQLSWETTVVPAP
ncbi:hypothetical protein VD0002_g7894 [Verticillium dahliae]|nr:hypothetical protein VD0002_g7894 [Verticillium dahliae]